MFVVSIDDDGDFVSEASNAALMKTFNLKHHQVDGVKLKNILDENTFKTISAAYTKCLMLHKPITYDESATIGNTGERFWSTTILPVVDNDGKTKIFGISREITQIKKAEKELHIINEKLDEEVKKRTKELEEANRQLKILSTIDDLTQLPNRRYFEEYFLDNWESAKKRATNISLIMCDIDYFKKINDTHGHLVGDLVLKHIAKTIPASSPNELDFVARYGGEEFAIVLYDVDLDRTHHICQNIQNHLTTLHTRFHEYQLHPITMSFGISSVIPREKDHPHKLIQHADNALYKAKNSGRNCIVTSALP